MGRIVLHVDMDAFFASAELLRHPEWRGRPLVVGSGPHERGVVSTCSYEARKYGVHSAMPSRTAYALCPDAIFTPPDMPYYAALSRAAFGVFDKYSPYIEKVSVDEAFLDISGTAHLYGGARTLGEALRADVRATTGLTCSIGIAPNRLLAKIGSELNKPDGLTMMPFEPREIREFLAPRPARILWGAGKKTVAALAPYGIATCGDIQRTPESALAAILGSPAAAAALKAHALGISSAEVSAEPEDEKSVSREWTFAEDETARELVRARLLRLVAQVGRRFRKKERWARTAKLKLRTADFTTFSRQAPFATPSRDDFAFRQAALSLFDEAWPEGRAMPPVRLIGFGVANMQNSPDGAAPALFEDPAQAAREKRERLSAALDRLHDKGLEIHAASQIPPGAR